MVWGIDFWSQANLLAMWLEPLFLHLLSREVKCHGFIERLMGSVGTVPGYMMNLQCEVALVSPGLRLQWVGVLNTGSSWSPVTG